MNTKFETVVADSELIDLKPYIEEANDSFEELIELKEIIPEQFEDIKREGSNVPLSRRPLIIVELPCKVDNPSRAIAAIGGRQGKGSKS